MRRFRKVQGSLVAAMLALVMLTTILYVLEFQREEQRLLGSYHLSFSERLTGLETALDNSLLHLKAAHAFAADYWRSHESGITGRRYLEEVEHNINGNYFKSLQDPSSFGLVFGVGRPEDLIPEAQKDLGLAFGLLPIFRAAKSQSDAILLYYFFSNYLISSNYPPVNLEGLLQMGGGVLERALSQFYVPHGGRQSASGGGPYFLPPYMDRAGHGLVVTYADPVYEGERFVGVVAADITATFFQSYITQFEGRAGRLLLVAENGTVLADTESDGLGEPNLEARLPAELKDWSGEIGSGLMVRRIGQYYINTQRMGNAPWVLVQLVPREDLGVVLFSSQITLVVGLLALIAVFSVAYFAVRRRSLQLELREREIRYGQVYNATSEAIFIHQADDGRILEVNAAFETMFGHPKEVAGRLSVGDISSGEPPYSQEDAVRHLRDCVEAGPQKFEWQSRRADGTLFWSEVSLRHVLLGDQSLVTAVVRDIDSRKLNEEELSRYRSSLEDLVSERTRELKAAQQELVRQEKMAVLGQLTATVSHELRNPLGTITNSLFVLAGQADSAGGPGQRALQRANRSVARCDAIIQELLDFTRSAGDHREEVEFDRWLAGVLDDLDPAESVETVVQLNAGRTILRIDPDRVRRCVINILDNAQHAISGTDREDGRVLVETDVQEEFLVVRFSDNGPGIPEEDRERVFEALYSTKSFGIGLGLAITRQIMEAHGGTALAMEGSQGGTTMELRFPRNSVTGV